MVIDASGLSYKELNERIKESSDKEFDIENLRGQRYIATGSKGKKIVIHGTPGNDVGAFLDGSEVEILSSAQDATGDTMNDGKIVIHGSAGDAAGYAMRGGKIYIRGRAGYRAGIHMKAYKEKRPLLIIGESAGSFLGEYQAGGTIIVLGLSSDGKPPVGFFCGTGMHGGKIYLRCNELPPDLPEQVIAEDMSEEDEKELREHLKDYAATFNLDIEKILKEHFFVLKPNSQNPYKRLYTHI